MAQFSSAALGDLTYSPELLSPRPELDLIAQSYKQNLQFN